MNNSAHIAALCVDFRKRMDFNVIFGVLGEAFGEGTLDWHQHRQ